MNGRFERFAPLAGVVFFLLAVAAGIVGGETPSADDPTGEVVSFWEDEEGKQIAASLLIAWASLFFVWFAASWRAAIAGAEGGAGRLASIVYGGALIFATGAALLAGLSFGAAETAGDVPPAVTQTLSVLSSELFFPLAVGISLFLLGSGVAILRTRVLPVWLGWVALLLGILAVTPAGFFAFLAAILLTVVFSILLFLRAGAAAGGPTPPAGAPGSPS